jgi:hypothetical protein
MANSFNVPSPEPLCNLPGHYRSILVVIRSSTARSSSTPRPGFAEAYT